MKKIKFNLLFFTGALLCVGLFLFFRPEKSEVTQSHLKPSQLNFSDSNELLTEQPKVDTHNTNNTSTENSRRAVENLTSDEKRNWSVFEEILKTKNDNDPRLDLFLKKLSPEFRQALQEKYEALAPEDHNGRGLVVYLIAREISSMDDFEFLKKIYQEPPCLSMQDCKSSPAQIDSHHSSMDQTTLIYEKLSALYLIDKQISENPQLLNNSTFRDGVIQVLAQAESFPIPAVHEKARGIRIKYRL